MADSVSGVVFQRSDGGGTIPRRALRKVLRRAKPPLEPDQSPAHRLNFWGNQSLSGTVQSLDQGKLQVRSLADQQLRVPLYLLASVAHAHGDAVMLRDDFEQGGVPHRHLTGAARSSGQAASGSWSCRLSQPGDQLSYELPTPVASGWLEVWFYDSGEMRGGVTWLCQLEFISAVGPRTLEILLGWEADSYGLATSEGPSLSVQRLARRVGWNRLAVRFQRNRTLVLIGEPVLTHAAVGFGDLRAVRFLVRELDGGQSQGEPDRVLGFVDDLQIAQSVGKSYSWQPSAVQDDVRLLNGDQLFGRIVGADQRQVTVRGQFGPHSVPWSEIGELRFNPRPCPVKEIVGLRVRTVFCATSLPDAPDTECDSLIGVLREVTDEAIRIEHPHIGPVVIRRDQFRELEFLSRGNWIAIDCSFHHFGDNFHLGLQVPHPEGPERSWRFMLQEVPASATLELYEVELESPGPGARYFEELQEGHLRTYLSLNGHELDRNGINHRVPLNSRGAVRLRIPVPVGVLKAGENVLRLHQTPQKEDTSSFDDCGIFAIGLDLGDSP